MSLAVLATLRTTLVAARFSFLTAVPTDFAAAAVLEAGFFVAGRFAGRRATFFAAFLGVLRAGLAADFLALFRLDFVVAIGTSLLS